MLFLIGHFMRFESKKQVKRFHNKNGFICAKLLSFWLNKYIVFVIIHTDFFRKYIRYRKDSQSEKNLYVW